MNETNRDIDVVITSHNQGHMIVEAVESICAQTLLPKRIIIVDDGSDDEDSLVVLKGIQHNTDYGVPITIKFQKNKGVSCARNTGMELTTAQMLLVLDGDDTVEPQYIDYVSALLLDHPSMVAASSWMHTFGVLDAVIQPSGGSLIPFLSRNCCPSTHIVKRQAFEQCKGYDASMRLGFEDWDYFLCLLETSSNSIIGMVKTPLINYRTNPASSNITSMEKRLDLMRFIIGKHSDSYHHHLTEALLGLERISDYRLYGWENEIIHSIHNDYELSESSIAFLEKPTYGDGGMAAAVRIQSL